MATSAEELAGDRTPELHKGARLPGPPVPPVPPLSLPETPPRASGHRRHDSTAFGGSRPSFAGSLTETDEESWEFGFDFNAEGKEPEHRSFKARTRLRAVSVPVEATALSQASSTADDNDDDDDDEDENWDKELFPTGLGPDDATSFATFRRPELFKLPEPNAAQARTATVSLLEELEKGLDTTSGHDAAWPQSIQAQLGSRTPPPRGSFLAWIEEMQADVRLKMERVHGSPLGGAPKAMAEVSMDVFGRFEQGLAHAELLMNAAEALAACHLLKASFAGFTEAFEAAPQDNLRSPSTDASILLSFERAIHLVCRIADGVAETGDSAARASPTPTHQASRSNASSFGGRRGRAVRRSRSDVAAADMAEQAAVDLKRSMQDAIASGRAAVSRLASLHDKFSGRGRFFSNELRLRRFEMEVHLTQLGLQRRRAGTSAMRNMLLIAELSNPSVVDGSNLRPRSSSGASVAASAAGAARRPSGGQESRTLGVRATCGAILFTRQHSCVTYEKLDTRASKMVLYDWVSDSADEDSGDDLPLELPDISDILGGRDSQESSDAFLSSGVNLSLAEALVAYFGAFSREWLFQSLASVHPTLRMRAAFVCGLIFHQPSPFFSDPPADAQGSPRPALQKHSSEPDSPAPEEPKTPVGGRLKSFSNAFRRASFTRRPSVPPRRPATPPVPARRPGAPTPLSWALQYDAAASALAEALFFEALRTLRKLSFEYPPDFPSPDMHEAPPSRFPFLVSRFAFEVLRGFAAALGANHKPHLAARVLETAALLLNFQGQEKAEAGLLRELLVLCATCGESERAVRHFPAVLHRALARRDVNEVGFLIELAIPMRVEIGQFQDALSDLNAVVDFLENLGILEPGGFVAGLRATGQRGPNTNATGPGAVRRMPVNPRTARLLLESILFRKALTLFSLHCPSDAADVLLALLKILRCTNQGLTHANSEVLRRKRECVLSWLAKAYYKSGRYAQATFTLEALMEGRGAPPPNPTPNPSPATSRSPRHRRSSRPLFRMGAGFSRHASSVDLEDCLLHFAFLGVPPEVQSAPHPASAPQHPTGYAGVHLDCAELYARATHKLAKEAPEGGGRHRVLALQVLAPAVLAVERFVYGDEGKVPREAFMELGRLYFLRAQIQLAMAEDESVAYPVTLTRHAIGDSVTPTAPTKNIIPAFPPANSARRNSVLSMAEFQPHPEFGPIPSPSDVQPSDLAPSFRASDPSPESEALPMRAHTRARRTHYRKYRCPEDLIWDALRWQKFAWECFKTTKDYHAASKCAAAIAEVHLNRLFLEVAVGNATLQEAGLLPRRSQTHTNPDAGFTPTADPVTFASTGDFVSLNDADLRPRVNTKPPPADDASVQRGAKLRKLNLEEAATAARIALSSAQELMNPFRLIHAHALTAQVKVLQGARIDGVGHFWEARDLFLHLFADGASLPALRFRSRGLHGKLGGILAHLLRFLAAADAPLLNQNLLLFDLQSLLAAEKLRSERQLFRQAVYRRSEAQDMFGVPGGKGVEVHPELAAALGRPVTRRHSEQHRRRSSLSAAGNLRFDDAAIPESEEPGMGSPRGRGVAARKSMVLDALYHFPRKEHERHAPPGKTDPDFGVGLGFPLQMPEATSLAVPTPTRSPRNRPADGFHPLEVPSSPPPRKLFPSPRTFRARMSSPRESWTEKNASNARRRAETSPRAMRKRMGPASEAKGGTGVASPEAWARGEGDRAAVTKIFECLRRFAYVSHAHAKGRYQLDVARTRNRAAIDALSQRMRSFRAASSQPTPSDVTFDEIIAEHQVSVASLPAKLSKSPLAISLSFGRKRPILGSGLTGSPPESPRSEASLSGWATPPAVDAEPLPPSGSPGRHSARSTVLKKPSFTMGSVEREAPRGAEARLRHMVYVQRVDGYLFLFCPSSGAKLLQRYQRRVVAPLPDQAMDVHAHSTHTLTRARFNKDQDDEHKDTEEKLPKDDGASTWAWWAQRASADPKGTLPYRKKHRRGSNPRKEASQPTRVPRKLLRARLVPTEQLREELENLYVENDLHVDASIATLAPASGTPTMDVHPWTHPEMERLSYTALRAVRQFLAEGYRGPKPVGPAAPPEVPEPPVNPPRMPSGLLSEITSTLHPPSRELLRGSSGPAPSLSPIPAATPLPLTLLVDVQLAHLPWELFCDAATPIQRAPTLLSLVRSFANLPVGHPAPTLATVAWNPPIANTFGTAEDDRRAVFAQKMIGGGGVGLKLGFGDGNATVSPSNAVATRPRRRSSFFRNRPTIAVAEESSRQRRSSFWAVPTSPRHRRAQTTAESLWEFVGRPTLSGSRLQSASGEARDPLESDRVVEAASKLLSSEAWTWPLLSSPLSVWPSPNPAVPPQGTRIWSLQLGLPSLCKPRFFRDFKVFGVDGDTEPEDLLAWCEGTASNQCPLVFLLGLEDLAAQSDALLRLMGAARPDLCLVFVPRGLATAFASDLSRMTRQWRNQQGEGGIKRFSTRLRLGGLRGIGDESHVVWRDVVQSLALHYRRRLQVPVVVMGM